MQSKLLRGTFILTVGMIISKILGLFYVIPFYHIVGASGTALYQYSYVPYTIFISIATAGVPLAVSKFVSKYNSIGEYAVGRKLFKSGALIMLLTGFVSFLILYFSAPFFADMMFSSKDQVKTNVNDITTVIRSVSFALIVVPFMSLNRGYFQGHESMGPSAASQLVEQIVRIIFTLVGAYVVVKFLKGSIVSAVSVATFAAFIGAIGGLITLFWYQYKRKPYMDELLKQDKGTMDISLKEIYKEIILYAAPFVFVGINNPLFQAIDQFTFFRAMGDTSFARNAFSILNFESQKIVIIPVSLATGFSLALVPSITKAFVEFNRKALDRQLDQAFQILLYLTLPASLGISLLAEPIYTVFYEHSTLGIDVLRVYAPVGILFALYLVTAAILQGINEQRFTVLTLLVGLLIKLALNIPLIKMLGTQGAVLATALGYMAAISINLFVIRKFADYNFRFVFRRSALIVIFSGLMWLGTEIVYKFLLLFLSPASKLQGLIIIFISAGVGAVIYFYLGMKSGLINKLFGDRVDRLKQKLRLRF
ncbi:putative polysaccharide biosynthesis protein [Neobacillus massiliamazoniensis]|jgi:O-antigen/teichoic acid export membrane protein|uniref:Polysaccharide biosynthesis protein n=1 Tax=Neobacillus massiliamazoniensis TaxID=1499688 RepID=A0A0U1P2I9_9BACI|nr:polysaccharide biosynthesis protein [Neobacillus massiliamazoniensis]CRK84470.1 polysaccharide biosynthesis protein [Neobacillus massiliamazoniensis]